MAELADVLDSLPWVRILSGRLIEQKKSRDGEQYDSAYQRAVLSYLYEGQRITAPIEFALGRNDPAYAEGDYFLAGDSFQSNPWRRLEMRKYGVKLVRIPEALLRLLEQDRARPAKAAA